MATGLIRCLRWRLFSSLAVEFTYLRLFFVLEAVLFFAAGLRAAVLEVFLDTDFFPAALRAVFFSADFSGAALRVVFEADAFGAAFLAVFLGVTIEAARARLLTTGVRFAELLRAVVLLEDALHAGLFADVDFFGAVLLPVLFLAGDFAAALVEEALRAGLFFAVLRAADFGLVFVREALAEVLLLFEEAVRVVLPDVVFRLAARAVRVVLLLRSAELVFLEVPDAFAVVFGLEAVLLAGAALGEVFFAAAFFFTVLRFTAFLTAFFAEAFALAFFVDFLAVFFFGAAALVNLRRLPGAFFCWIM